MAGDYGRGRLRRAAVGEVDVRKGAEMGRAYGKGEMQGRGLSAQVLGSRCK